jgi:hypothetical protein
MELLEELPEPTSFSHIIDHGAILSLGARSRDDVLSLGGLGDEIVAKEHSVAQSGPACIRATHLVRIHVDHQRRRRQSVAGGGRSPGSLANSATRFIAVR